jgi:hypothetical protein
LCEITQEFFYFVIKFGRESKSPKRQLRAFCGELRKHPEAQEKLSLFFFTMSSGCLQAGRHIDAINPN